MYFLSSYFFNKNTKTTETIIRWFQNVIAIAPINYETQNCQIIAQACLFPKFNFV